MESGNIKNWLGAHTLPVELKLIYTDGIYKIKQVPVEELKRLRFPEPMYKTENKRVSEGDKNLLADLKGQLYEIEAAVTLGSASGFGFKVRTGNDDETVINYDVAGGQLVLNRAKSGIALSEGGDVLSVDMAPVDGKVTIRILVDTSVIDIYGNDGDAVINTYIYPSESSVGMAFYVQGGDVTIDSLTVYKLDSIHFPQLSYSGAETTEFWV